MLAEIRQAIADAVTAGIPGVQCTPYILGRPTPPAGHVTPDTTTYDLAMGRGMDEWHLKLTIFVAETTDIGAQVLLDAFLEPSGARSIKQAVEVKDAFGQPSLGGVVDNVRVVGNSGYQRYQVEGGGVVLGSEWQITVFAGG